MSDPLFARREIARVLQQAAADASTVVIHSSLPGLRPEGASKWDFLYGLRELIATGRTVAIPTFTFSFCKDGLFDPKVTPSQVGILGDWALRLPEFRRTNHPIYSFAVAGPLADAFLACQNETTFGETSAFRWFESQASRLIMMGCDWSYCTQFHAYEEEAAVPYREFKTFAGASGTNARMFVRRLETNIENDFLPAVDALRAEGRISTVPLFSGMVESVACTDLAVVCRRLLRGDPHAFARKTGARAASGAGTATPKSVAIKVALVGSSTLDFLADTFRSAYAAILKDHPIEVHHVPFGQRSREIADTGSTLYSFDARFSFFVERLEDLVGVASLQDADTTRLESALQRYLDDIAQYRDAVSGTIFVNSFCASQAPLLRQAQATGAGNTGAVIARANSLLAEQIGLLADVHLIDVGLLAMTAGARISDDRLWAVGRIPFSNRFTEALAHRFTTLIAAATGRTARLIVVDLDNTLWGGVLGEDGEAGIQLGGDYPGNAFVAFQKALKHLSRNGIAVAICSKNDEAEALAVIGGHPEMVLRPSDFVAHRINWKVKADNVADICDSLGLGLRNVLFIDDNPAERERMRVTLPDVLVLDLPEDPAQYTEALRDCPWLEMLQLTAEDKKRVEQYKARETTMRSRSQFSDPETFFRSLQTRVHIQPLDRHNEARAVQLISKTNQFNTSGRRYSSSELRRLNETGFGIYVIGAEDKFSEFENIGVLIVDWENSGASLARVDNYLLSCRALGRGIETGVLCWLVDKARSKGVSAVQGEIVESPRNLPARSVFADAGFRQIGEANHWHAAVDSGPGMPNWLAVLDFTAA